MSELPARPVNTRDLPTPALVVRQSVFEANVARMSAARPGRSLRPHVKAFKSTALARKLAEAGHDAFCCATPAEVVGMASAGLDADLLLANECLDADRLRAMADLDAAVTVAVDSEETVEAAAAAGIPAVLVDVNVGLPRCGCRPVDAGRIADRARAAGSRSGASWATRATSRSSRIGRTGQPRSRRPWRSCCSRTKRSAAT